MKKTIKEWLEDFDGFIVYEIDLQQKVTNKEFNKILDNNHMIQYKYYSK